MQQPQKITDIKHRLDAARTEETPLLVNDIRWLVGEVEYLQKRLDDVNLKDEVKTHEINLLTKEIRAFMRENGSLIEDITRLHKFLAWLIHEMDNTVDGAIGNLHEDVYIWVSHLRTELSASAYKPPPATDGDTVASGAVSESSSCQSMSTPEHGSLGLVAGELAMALRLLLSQIDQNRVYGADLYPESPILIGARKALRHYADQR